MRTATWHVQLDVISTEFVERAYGCCRGKTPTRPAACISFLTLACITWWGAAGRSRLSNAFRRSLRAPQNPLKFTRRLRAQDPCTNLENYNGVRLMR